LTSFQALGLSAPLLHALAAEGYTTPTPIQLQAIPPALEGRDVEGIAQTGTGKTAAFALPILHRLHANPRRAPPRSARALVLAPTRELAAQIAESFRAYGRETGLRTTLMFGGVPKGKQARAMMHGIDVLVATPGRLLDHIGDGAVNLQGVEVLVLDEADHMLDLGFIVPIRKLASMLPRERQGLFFSATMPKEIAQLSATLLRDPVRVAVTPVATTAERVEQRVVFVEQGEKRNLLARVLKRETDAHALVFTRTKHGADRVCEHLGRAGVPAAAIHGNKSQGQRERALGAFREGEIRVLVATDIAARGIDVDGVTHVINYELPNVPESYVHRIGRTARAGRAGLAISFCDATERPFLRDIEKLIRTRVTVADPQSL
jgi:ATP-dependent RNA helicase RhlE